MDGNIRSEIRKAYAGNNHGEIRRRVTPVRLPAEAGTDVKSVKEIIILQGIICAIILALVMAVSVIGAEPAPSIKKWLKSAVSANITAEDISGGLADVLAYIERVFKGNTDGGDGLGITDGINAEINGNLDGESADVDIGGEAVPVSANAGKPASSQLDARYTDVNFRIDEDILDRLLNTDDPYLNN